jgi:hypothetical protein
LGSRGPSRSRHPRIRKPARHGTARGILAYTHPIPGEAVKAGSIVRRDTAILAGPDPLPGSAGPSACPGGGIQGGGYGVKLLRRR